MAMDKNGDGEISCPEYTLYMLQQMRLVEPDVVKQLQDQFRQLDTDKSGTLTLDGERM
jgi:hypothetical protein